MELFGTPTDGISIPMSFPYFSEVSDMGVVWDATMGMGDPWGPYKFQQV